MFITKEMLLGKNACTSQVNKFEQYFPTGVEVTEAVAEQYAGQFNVGWLARHFLTAPLLAKYDLVVAQLQAEYKLAWVPLWEKYERSRVLQWSEYERELAPLLAKFDREVGLLFVRLTRGEHVHHQENAVG